MNKVTFLIEKDPEADNWSVFKITKSTQASDDNTNKIIKKEETECVEVISLENVPRQELGEMWLLRIKPYLIMADEITIKS